MTTALQTAPDATAIEQVLVGGDLSKLTTDQRVSFYNSVCSSLGLNPLTRPFDYINLNGKLTLYAKRDATDQLRNKRAVSIGIVDRQQTGDLYIVRAMATLPDGRGDESLGAVSTAGLKGEALANAIMKAETKAKRRVTLSICGLGWLDETEVDSIPDARPERASLPPRRAPVAPSDPRDPDDALPPRETVNPTTGEIVSANPDHFRIREVRELKNGMKGGSPWTLFGVTVDTGSTFLTFSSTVADQAEAARQCGEPLEIHTEPAKNGKDRIIVSCAAVAVGTAA